MLCQRDAIRCAGERVLDGARPVPGDLDHLPVALVHVVELVEVPEEPVLQCDALHARLAQDVGVDGRALALHQLTRGLFVRAAGVQRIARDVEVVGLAQAGDLTRGRSLGHHCESGLILGRAAQQLHGGIAEHDRDRGRDELLAVAVARPGLGLEHHDRHIAIRELLRGRVVRGARECRARARQDERDRGDQECGRAARTGSESPRHWWVVSLNQRTSARAGGVPRIAATSSSTRIGFEM